MPSKLGENKVLSSLTYWQEIGKQFFGLLASKVLAGLGVTCGHANSGMSSGKVLAETTPPLIIEECRCFCLNICPKKVLKVPFIHLVQRNKMQVVCDKSIPMQ
jgi:hypothetical protein